MKVWSPTLKVWSPALRLAVFYMFPRKAARKPRSPALKMWSPALKVWSPALKVWSPALRLAVFYMFPPFLSIKIRPLDRRRRKTARKYAVDVDVEDHKDPPKIH